MSWLLLASLVLAMNLGDQPLVAGRGLTLQLEVPPQVQVEVRLIDGDGGTLVARKTPTQLTPGSLRFATPDWLRRAALELWVDGRLELRLPETQDHWLEFAPATEPGCQAEAVNQADGGAAQPVALPCELAGAALAGVDLRGRRLDGMDLSRTDLRGTQLSDASLTEADLTASIASGANFEGANLSNASLVGADLGGARLYVAELEGADLRSANLAGANLTNANLANADLLGANLQRAVLTGAEFAGARCPDGTRTQRSCRNHLVFE